MLREIGFWVVGVLSIVQLIAFIKFRNSTLRKKHSKGDILVSNLAVLGYLIIVVAIILFSAWN